MIVVENYWPSSGMPISTAPLTLKHSTIRLNPKNGKGGFRKPPSAELPLCFVSYS
jgi:hypothetical protein